MRLYGKWRESRLGGGGVDLVLLDIAGIEQVRFHARDAAVDDVRQGNRRAAIDRAKAWIEDGEDRYGMVFTLNVDGLSGNAT